MTNAILNASVGVFLTALHWLVFTPACMYYLYRFIHVQEFTVIQKRYPKLVIISCVGCIFWLSVLTPLWLLADSFPDTLLWNLLYLTPVLYPSISQGVLYCLLCRYWITFFRCNWTLATEFEKQWQWQMHIRRPTSALATKSRSSTQNNNHSGDADADADVASDADADAATRSPSKLQWYLDHRHTYGSVRWMSRRIFIVYVCVDAMVTLVVLFAMTNGAATTTMQLVQVIDLLAYLIVFIITLVIWRKTTTIKDLIFYREEMKRIHYALCIALSTYLLSLALNGVVDDLVFRVLLMVSGSTIALSVALFPTLWVLRQIRHANQDSKSGFFSITGRRPTSFTNSPAVNDSMMNMALSTQSQSQLQSSSSDLPTPTTPPKKKTPTTMASLNSVSAESPIDIDVVHEHIESRSPSTDVPYKQTTKQKLTLRRTLSAADSLNVFMQHLSMEYSMELLLAFIEFHQFIGVMRGDAPFMAQIRNLAEIDEENRSEASRVRLPESMPKSYVVFDQFAAGIGDVAENENESKNNNRESGPPSSLKTYLQIANMFYIKYIAEDSEYQINIDWKSRAFITSWIEKNAVAVASKAATETDPAIYADLLVLFEPCVLELYYLMEHVHYRYRYSKM